MSYNLFSPKPNKYFKIRQILGSRSSSSNYYCLLKYNARQFVKKDLRSDVM